MLINETSSDDFGALAVLCDVRDAYTRSYHFISPVMSSGSYLACDMNCVLMTSCVRVLILVLELLLQRDFRSSVYARGLP